MEKKCVSFVIPCYKSEQTIKTVIDEIIFTMDSLNNYDYEIICVDDNSPDHVFEIICNIAKRHPCVRGIRFSKNFGQHSAILAGIRYATGDIVVTLDDDGQCPIEHIDKMFEPLTCGWDISIAKYGKKKQNKFKNFGSALNELTANLLIDKPRDIQMGNFMAFKKFVAEEINEYQGPYPYLSGMLFRSSAKIINVPMEERSRMQGTTTYTLRKLVGLWVSGFTAFSIIPLRMATAAGVFLACGGVGYAILVLVRKILHPEISAGWSSIIIVNLIVGGMLLIVLGIMGEYIGRIYMSLNNTPQYVICDTCNIED